MYDESFMDFKNYFFKVRAVEGARPFFLEANDEPAFSLCWQQNVVVSRYTWEMIDEVEQAFVNVLEDIWGEPPHLDTKKFLGDPSLVRTALEMAKNNDSMKAFKKARKATTAQNISAKVAGEGSFQVLSKPSVPSSPGPRRMIPTPQVRLVDPLQAFAATSSPTGAPPPKKQKTAEPFNLDAPDFDAIEFVDQQIGPYGTMLTDDVSLLRHLNFITRSSVKMAHIGAALYRTAQDLPIHATKAFMEEAKLEFNRMKGLQEELEMKVTKLEKELEGEKASSIALAASVRLAEDTALKHKESYVTTYREMMRLRDYLEYARADYVELQGHLVGSVNAAYENLKEQVRVLAPELDLTLFSLDNIVKDGKIVPDDAADDDVDPPSVPATKSSIAPTPLTPSAEVGHPESKPDCQILNRDDRTVDAVPLQTRPPSPRVDVAEKSLDP
ncbi:uncharacterized protein [Arachis hypogaea]|uniref:uncharacterized protein n=1 Tax=Arachis hypogaea TaxID=3818 RepID=UPI003B21503F